MDDFLIALFGVSFIIGAAALLMWLFRGKLRRLVKGSGRYLLWSLIIIRLCIPLSAFGGNSLVQITVPEGFSSEQIGEESVVFETVSSNTENLVPNYAVKEENVMPEAPQTHQISNVENAEDVFIPSQSVQVESEENIVSADTQIDASENLSPTVNEVVSDSEQPVQTAVIFENNHQEELMTDKVNKQIDPVKAVFFLWLMVAVFFLLAEMIEYVRFLEHLSSRIKGADGEILNTYLEVAKKLKIKNPPKLYVSGEVTSPMLVGLVKPIVILPELDLKKSAWEGIMTHELTHFRRGDLWVKLLGVVAKSIHWFNPAAYIAVRMLNEEMELSCDEKALKNVTEEGRIEYGTVMVDILKKCKGRVNALSTHFNPHKNTAKSRIMNILDNSKKRKGMTLIILSLIVCVVAGSVFGCVSLDKPEEGGEQNGEKEHLCAFEAIAAREATCLDYGISGGKKCMECGKESGVSQITNALGHSFESGICTRCGQKTSEGLVFRSNGNGTCTLISNGTCRDEVFVVPEYSPDGEVVTKVGREFGSYHFMKTLVLPNTVELIESGALRELSALEKIVLPNSLKTIEGNILYDCDKLEELVIPSKVTMIKSRLLIDSSGLKAFYVDKDNKKYRSESNCLIETTNKELVWGFTNFNLSEDSDVLTIGSQAFYNCSGLTELVIPEGVKKIGDYAFIGCSNLKKAILPSSVEEIGEYAFINCTSLETVELSQWLNGISQGLFCGCSSLKAVNLPASVGFIQLYAFQKCDSLESVSFKESNGWYSVDVYNIEYKVDFSDAANNAKVLKTLGVRLEYRWDGNKKDLEEKPRYEKIKYSKKAETVNWEYPTDGTSWEKNEKGEYSYIKFYTDSTKWSLSYSYPNGHLLLTDGNREYYFGNDVANPDNRIIFYPSNGEKSAVAIISPDEKHAAIIAQSTMMAAGDIDGKILYVIDLTDGNIEYYVTAKVNELAFTNDVSVGIFSEYGALYYETPLAPPLVKSDINAEFRDDGSFFIQRQILSFDGKIRLYDEGYYNFTEERVSGFKAAGEYESEVYTGNIQDTTLKLKNVEYYPNAYAWDIPSWSKKVDLRDYYVTLSVPEQWENESPFFHETTPFVNGVTVWQAFSVEENYVFQDDFIDYAAPLRNDNLVLPEDRVFSHHNLESFTIERGVTAKGYKYISYNKALYYLRVSDNLVWAVEFGSSYYELSEEVRMAIIDSFVLHISAEEAHASNLEEIGKLDVDNGIKNMAIALLTNDTDEMERLAGCKAGTYALFKDVEFGLLYAYTVGTVDKKMMLQVNVNNVPVGLSFSGAAGGSTYFYIYSGPNGVELSDATVWDADKPATQPYMHLSFLRKWFATPTFDYEIKMAEDIPTEEMESYSFWLYDFLYNYVIGTNNSYTDRQIADMCKKYATEYFGLTDHSGYDKLFKANSDGVLTFVGGHGGHSASYSIESFTLYNENGQEVDSVSAYRTIEAVVVVYADPGRNVISQKIKYTLVCGEVFPESVSYEKVSDTGYTPYSGITW